jgi:hypothetical protein
MTEFSKSVEEPSLGEQDKKECEQLIDELEKLVDELLKECVGKIISP